MKLVMGYLFVLTAHASFLSEMSVSNMTQPNRSSQSATQSLSQEKNKDLKPSLTENLAGLNDKKVNQFIKNTIRSASNKQNLKNKMTGFRDVIQKNKNQILSFSRADISNDIKSKLGNIKRNAQKRVDILNNVHNQ